MEGIYQIKRNILKKDFDLKIQCKEQNLDYIRNILLSSSLTGGYTKTNLNNINNANVNVLNNNISKGSPNLLVPVIKENANELKCKQCNTEVTETQRCASCQDFICKSCIKNCNNTQTPHTVNGFCPTCLYVKCVLCREAKNCKICIKKCFHMNCPNTFCNACYDKNKHQVRPENTNCRFYKCDSCQTDTNCIMTTIYCAKCDRRICKDCYFNHHLGHNNR
jgi:hypothetical protein